jgi:WD40 repeat protein
VHQPSASKLIAKPLSESSVVTLLTSSDAVLRAAAGNGLHLARPLRQLSGLESAQGMCTRVLKSPGPVALSLDGRFAVAGSVFDDCAVVWDVGSGDQMWVLRGHSGRVTSVAIAGRLVLTGSAVRFPVVGMRAGGGADGALRHRAGPHGAAVGRRHRKVGGFAPGVLGADARARPQAEEDAQVACVCKQQGRA